MFRVAARPLRAVTPQARLALREPCLPRKPLHTPTRVHRDRRRAAQSRAGCGHCPPCRVWALPTVPGVGTAHRAGRGHCPPCRKCCDAISNPNDLCLAYHMPGVFYYAEGGWGHHMKSIGNHPALENPVSFMLVMEDFRNTVVAAGSCRLGDMVRLLQDNDYIPRDTQRIIVDFIGALNDRWSIPLIDARMTQSIRDVMQYIHSSRPEGAYEPVISFR
ncbi:MAG: hypothetical protein ACI4O7_03855 [Aristaeellaceae bacterium]